MIPMQSRRRVTLGLLLTASAAALGPFRALIAMADERIRRLGFVHSGSSSTTLSAEREFWQRLRELGWIEGNNLVIVKRFADGRYDRLPGLVAEVVNQDVDVLVVRDTPAAIAARNATGALPIVAAGIGDPLRSGLVASLARPGGNLTGLSLQFAEGIPGKWVELLQEMIPQLSTVAVISNPDNPAAVESAQALKKAASERDLKLLFIEVRRESEYDRAFRQARQRAQGVIVGPDPLAITQRRAIVALAVRYRVPAVYGLRDFVEDGGLICYSPTLAAIWRRAAEYVDRIFMGTNPSDLPIELVSSFELVINLRAAKAIGISIPQSLLGRADTVMN
jgi:putative tryptophan/tyrosine transport system substrate-binding protein